MSAVVDLWADVAPEHLPPPLVDAFERKDWPAVKSELHGVMDGITTDASAYGRELLSLVRKLPLGIDPTFDRYRAIVGIDYGEWDVVQRCLDLGTTARDEIECVRDAILAPLTGSAPRQRTEPRVWMAFEACEHLLSQHLGRRMRWAAAAQQTRPIDQWSRGDASIVRHARFRQLQDVFELAISEAHSGRLPAAAALAHEAQALGNGWEPHRVAMRDLGILAYCAMGDPDESTLSFLDLVRSPRGPSPLGSWEMIAFLMPLFAAVRIAVLAEAAVLQEQIALRLASPRALMQANAWKTAALASTSRAEAARAIPALLVQSRSAAPSLRVLPLIVSGSLARRYDDFAEAERIARQVRNVWAQVTAMVWMTALDPTPLITRHLVHLLEMTGWRRPAFVPPEIASDAALATFALGHRSNAAVELAAVSGRSIVALDLARRQVEDHSVPLEAKLAAVDVLATLRTTHAEQMLRGLAARPDDVGRRASQTLVRPSAPFGLSEREIEVLRRAGEGLSNREIAETLVLSPHTVARHIANARARLGARNRAEAAARLAGTLEVARS